MITTNFEKILRFFPNALPDSAAASSWYGIPIIDVTGTMKYFRPFVDTDCLPTFSKKVWGGGNNANAGWRFGSGITPATKNDYNMEAPITANLSLLVQTANLILENDTYKTIYTLTIKNNSDSDMSISEIGYIGRCYASTAQQTSAASTGVLFMREVLNEPIIISPKETTVINAYIESPFVNQ